MNLVSLITFTAFIVYICLGLFGLQLDPRSRLNRIFFCLCLACALWAFCIAFMFPAGDKNMAWFWFRLSTPGWCLGPALVLHFTLALTGWDQSVRTKLPIYLIYLPGLIFTVLGITVGVTATDVVALSFGWSPINSGDMIRYWAYAAYYLACIAGSVILVWKWGQGSPSRRQQRQAQLVVYSTVLGTLLAFVNETLLPGMGYNATPKVPVVLWLIWAFGMWTAISRYRLMIFTPAIATNAIIASITDMMVVLDLDSRILKTNPSFKELLEYTDEDLLDQPLTRICPTWDDKNGPAGDLIKGSSSYYQEESEWITKAGTAIPVGLSASAVKDRYNDLACLVLVAQDLRPTKKLEWEISERRRAQQALQETVLQIKDYSVQLEEQNHKLEHQYAELEAMTASLAEANETLEQKNSQLENLFNNVGQGFLSFSEDLLIHPESSRECLSIFRQNPAGKRLSSLFYPQDPEQKKFLDTLLGKILQEPDPVRLELYMSLLPEEINLHERCISIEYRAVQDISVDRRNILVILTDISEKRRLEASMQQEKDIFSMVIKAIMYRDDLIESITDFKSFITFELQDILFSQNESDAVLAELLRIIHTFKGNFSQFETTALVGELHHLESILLEARDLDTELDRQHLLQIMGQFQLMSCLESDLQIIKSFLGPQFFEQKDAFTISKDRLLNLEQTMQKALSPAEYQLLLPVLRSLRYKSFKELLKSYPEYVQKMASRLGKEVHPFTIQGDDLLVDSDYYHSFARSLVHVFRNCVDHGLENPETRVLNNKDEIGNVHCSIEEKNRRIIISISDDGQGIDFNRLRQRAAEMGIYSPDEAERCSEEHLLELIFVKEFSTQTEASLISGRGVGLWAVQAELEKIGGQVNVVSHPDTGTEFIFDLPVADSSGILPTIDLVDILNAVTASAASFIAGQTEFQLEPASELEQRAAIVFDKATALIIIQGINSSIIALSYSDELLDELLQAFLIGTIGLEEKESLTADLLAEASNIIVGNSLQRLGLLDDLLTISTPVIECSKSSILKHSRSAILCQELMEGCYTLTISLVSMDDGLLEQSVISET